MLVQKFPKASREKHLLRGFSAWTQETDSLNQTRTFIVPKSPQRGFPSAYPYFWGLSPDAARARNAYTGVTETASMSLRKKTSKRAARIAEIIIPDKLYFRIGEVATLCRLPAYVLRFWETEFPQLKPVKSSTGQRMYRKRDVESVVRIKKLLYEDGFTIAGARTQLREEIKSDRTQSALPFPVTNSPINVAHMRNELQQILHILSARR